VKNISMGYNNSSYLHLDLMHHRSFVLYRDKSYFRETVLLRFWSSRKHAKSDWPTVTIEVKKQQQLPWCCCLYSSAIDSMWG